MIWLDSVNGWRKVEWVEKVEQGELLQVQQRSWYVEEEVELNRLEKVVGDDLEVELNKLEKVVEDDLNGRSVQGWCSKQTKDGPCWLLWFQAKPFSPHFFARLVV